MRNNNKRKSDSSKIVGAGLVALDIIINNGAQTPIFSAGGTCGNVLAGLSFLGWESTAISRAGMDLAGGILIQDLLDNGVNIEHITQEEKLGTPRIVERLNSNGVYAKHSFLLRCPTCHAYLPRFRSPRLEVIDDFIGKKCLNPEVYLFDRVTPATLKLAKNYREAGALIFFEPINLKNTDGLERALNLSHIVKYAGDESEKRFEKLGNGQIMKKIRSFGPALVIQTLGKYGLSFINGKKRKPQYRESFEINRIYDSCGAGDWCTVGFLFYLQELARDNNVRLLETLASNALINYALSFGQILASLSCMFIGARGLSSSMKPKDIIRIVHTHLKKGHKINLPIDKYFSGNRISLTPTSERIANSNTCPTCLLSE